MMDKKLLLLLVAVSLLAGFLYFKTKAFDDGDKPAVSVSGRDHILGRRNAEVVLIEYSDLECPFCVRFHPTMQQLKKDYGDRLAWVFRHYPLPIHINAQKEAEATECAAEQGGDRAFWQYVDAVYDRTKGGGIGFALDQLVPLAEELGLDKNKFKQCLDDGKYSQKISEQMRAGAAAGVEGTPATFIITKNGGKDFINGAQPYDQIKKQIDALIK